MLAATGEILLGDSDALVRRLEAAGAPHSYDRVPGLWHDFVLYAGLLAEADEAVSRLGEALRAGCVPATGS